MTRLLLATHALTAWNVAGRYQGQTDIPLNERGREQAARLRLRLAPQTIHFTYTSDLSRAWETARVIAQDRELMVRPEPRLRELHFGAWEGLTYSQIQQADPGPLAAWEANPEQVAPPGGESLAKLASRLDSFLATVRGRQAEETLLVVAHRGSLRVLICLALGLPPAAWQRFRLNVASLSELELHAGSVVLTLLNDTHHLGGEPCLLRS